MAEHNDSIATILFALGANAVIALAKGIVAWITGSTSMVAEAVHSVADCGNQSLLLLGLNRSTRPPDAEYPLGHGRAIYFWSFIVALMLFSMGGLFSIYECSKRSTAVNTRCAQRFRKCAGCSSSPTLRNRTVRSLKHLQIS